MGDVADLLTVLQHGDSQFPSGTFAFSWGMEGLLQAGLLARDDLADFIEGQFRQRWCSFERVLIAEAHRLAADLPALAALDDLVDAATVTAAARTGSVRSGNALLSVHVRLATPHAAAFREMIQDGLAHGHATTVQGLAMAGVELDLPQSLTVAAHQTAAAFCTAAIRLGMASHLDAQRTLMRLRPVIAGLIQAPLPPLEEITGFTPASEIAMMRHAGQEFRLFSN